MKDRDCIGRGSVADKHKVFVLVPVPEDRMERTWSTQRRHRKIWQLQLVWVDTLEPVVKGEDEVRLFYVWENFALRDVGAQEIRVG